ncbi:hypothetical protein RvY_17152-2 [Ramazzottius varieornatus]|uniref:Uncharacterized protein n=1 Tax=Ramazzottius varieornatus TaxID=947166 RepID=A0A1D1W547_RAMVA|nr:hypothetical protein RvY_17152-2 [Ramazzottius varieornatus]
MDKEVNTVSILQTTTTTTTTTTRTPTTRTTTTTVPETTTTEETTTTPTTTPTTTTTTTTTTKRTTTTPTTTTTHTTTTTTSTTTTMTTPTTSTTTICADPNVCCDCDPATNMFLQGECCKNAFSLICDGIEAEIYLDNCPVLRDGTRLTCNSSTQLCDCPYGVIQAVDKMSCVGPEFILEPSVLRTAISESHDRLSQCDETDAHCCPFCYPELEATTCICNETSDLSAVPVCFCHFRTPRSIRCI